MITQTNKSEVLVKNLAHNTPVVLGILTVTLVLWYQVMWERMLISYILFAQG